MLVGMDVAATGSAPGTVLAIVLATAALAALGMAAASLLRRRRPDPPPAAAIDDLATFFERPPGPGDRRPRDRNSVAEGKSVDLGGPRIM